VRKYRARGLYFPDCPRPPRPPPPRPLPFPLPPPLPPLPLPLAVPAYGFRTGHVARKTGLGRSPRPSSLFHEPDAAVIASAAGDLTLSHVTVQPAAQGGVSWSLSAHRSWTHHFLLVLSRNGDGLPTLYSAV
jgi:hypothetical protein